MANTSNVVSIDQGLISGKNRRKKPYAAKAHAKKKSDPYFSNQSPSKQTLSSQQVEQMVKVAMRSRHGSRDAALILLAYQHGLKVSELINLKWEHIDFENKSLLVSRLKNGDETLQTLAEREIKLLKELAIENDELVFMSQRRSKMTSLHVRNIIKHAGEEAGFKMSVYPAMLTGKCKINLVSGTLGSSITKH